MPNEKKTIDRELAAKLLAEKTHLTKLQIEQFLGRRRQIGEETVNIAIQVSDGHEKLVRKKMLPAKKRARMVQPEIPSPTFSPNRLSVKEATRELADFTQSQVP